MSLSPLLSLIKAYYSHVYENSTANKTSKLSVKQSTAVSEFVLDILVSKLQSLLTVSDDIKKPKDQINTNKSLASSGNNKKVKPDNHQKKLKLYNNNKYTEDTDDESFVIDEEENPCSELYDDMSYCPSESSDEEGECDKEYQKQKDKDEYDLKY